MTKVLITGAGGFLGSGLAARLASHGEIQVETMAGPIDGSVPWDGEIVIHAAGAIRTSHRNLYESNVDTVHEVLQMAPEARLVLLSSRAVYGDWTGPEPVDENHPRTPRDRYGRTKAAAEELVLSSAAESLVLRLSTVWAGLHPIAAAMTRSALGAGSITIDPRPLAIDPLEYNDALGLILGLTLNRQCCGPVNIAGPRVSLEAMADRVAHRVLSLGRPCEKRRGSQPVPRGPLLDCRHAFTYTEFRPATSAISDGDRAPDLVLSETL